LRVGDDGDHSVEEVMGLTREAGFGAEVKRRIMLGTYALSSGYYDAYYGSAQQVRTLIIRDFDRAFADVDVLVSPTTPTTAFKIGERADDPMAMYLADLCTIPTNLAATPGCQCPAPGARGRPPGRPADHRPGDGDDRCTGSARLSRRRSGQVGPPAPRGGDGAVTSKAVSKKKKSDGGMFGLVPPPRWSRSC